MVVALRELQNNPRPAGAKKLRGPIHCISVGDWHTVYAVFDKDGLVIADKIVKLSENAHNKPDRIF